MRVNLPVTQRDYDYPADEMLVSMTNTRGEITHCNPAFARVSGYTHDELIGQPHNLIRHPDMPPAAFKDAWSTIGRGKPWIGMVKNRRKNGDSYWVLANFTPILVGRKPKAYMSVRTKPTQQQIDEAEALYARMRAEAASGRVTLLLRGGKLRHTGFRGWLERSQDIGLATRVGSAMVLMVLVILVPDMFSMQGWQAPLWRLVSSFLGVAAISRVIHKRFVSGIAQAERFAGEIAGCNLTTSAPQGLPGSLGGLIHALLQIQVNLRAVIGDVRVGVNEFTRTAGEIAQGSAALSERTESGASSLEETAAAMDELGGTVANTVQVMTAMASESERSNAVAGRGVDSIAQVRGAMEQLRSASGRMSEIVGTIESIAFQTNLLALNAAVEAARAGEQGRGFAVVAAEVRGLARRSADAAKEIGGLIRTMVDGIADGAQRMGQAGHTIEEMVGTVQRVGAQVAQITAAANEQASGIGQVNQAVARLDDTMQQNAALAEQSAAAAQTLRDGAHSIDRSVAVFHLA